MYSIKRALAVSVAALVLPAGAYAGSITPETYTGTIGVGESVTITKTVTTDASGVGVVDFYFLADNTGSMGGTISAVRNTATALTTALNATFADAAFGVGRYFGDPSEPGMTPATAYDVLRPITTNAASAVTAMDGWIASGGGDGPEANLFALQQAATNGANPAGPGTGGGESTGWRTGATKVILWFGDITGHQIPVNLAEAIAALTSENVIVIGLNNTSLGGGIDGIFDDDATDGTDNRNQARAITTATGGTLVNNFSSVATSNIVSVITAAIGSVTSTIDLSLTTVGDTTGLNVAFACTDALGCLDVKGGESRTFSMTVTGVTPGHYTFDVIAPGVSGATETDDITVTGEGPGPTPVPEPGTLLLLGAGFLALGAARRAQRK